MMQSNRPLHREPELHETLRPQTHPKHVVQLSMTNWYHVEKKIPNSLSQFDILEDVERIKQNLKTPEDTKFNSRTLITNSSIQ